MFLIYFIERLERVTGMLQSCAENAHPRIYLHLNSRETRVYQKKDFKL